VEGRSIQIRVAEDLASKLKYLAAAQGVNYKDYISNLIRAEVEARFRDAIHAVGGTPHGGR
jgi:predicted DNA binding CopG/RHH family protein